MKKKTILVTGGAGFIGSHTARRLETSGYYTVILDNLSRGSRQTIGEIEFVQGSCGDSKLLSRLFSDYSFDAVIHFAAYIDVGESVKHPALYYANNFSQTLGLLEMMIRHNIQTFIFSSSAAVYGIPHTTLIAENHINSPLNPYGETKKAVETALKDFEKAYGLKSCSLRYFNAAGGDPKGKIGYHQPNKTNLIPILLDNIEKNLPLTIYGSDYPTPDGTCIRDYVHIDDLASAHILAMESLFEGTASSAYNLGNGQGYSVRQVVQSAEKTLGLKIPIIEGPRREGDPPILVADATKAIKELGWNPRYPDLQSMIEHASIARKQTICHV